MRRAIILLLLLLVPTLAWAEPTIAKAINDQESVLLRPDDHEARHVQYRRQKGLQMAVLIIDSTNGEPIEAYALRVASVWKGGGAERNDGVLFVLAI